MSQAQCHFGKSQDCVIPFQNEGVWKREGKLTLVKVGKHPTAAFLWFHARVAFLRLLIHMKASVGFQTLLNPKLIVLISLCEARTGQRLCSQWPFTLAVTSVSTDARLTLIFCF